MSQFIVFAVCSYTLSVIMNSLYPANKESWRHVIAKVNKDQLRGMTPHYSAWKTLQTRALFCPSTADLAGVTWHVRFVYKHVDSSVWNQNVMNIRLGKVHIQWQTSLSTCFSMASLICGCSNIFLRRKSGCNLHELSESITTSAVMPLELGVTEVRAFPMSHYWGLLLPLYNGGVHQIGTRGYFCCKTVYPFPV